MSDASKHTHAGDGTVPGLHGEPIPTPVLGCPVCATVSSIGGELGAVPEGPAPSLAEFLLACFAEDEAVAREAGERSGWRTYPDNGWVQVSSGHVLAECEARRQIVSEHAEWLGNCTVCAENGRDELEWSGFPCKTLRYLALPYADRPGYREEWRP